MQAGLRVDGRVHDLNIFVCPLQLVIYVHDFVCNFSISW